MFALWEQHSCSGWRYRRAIYWLVLAMLLGSPSEAIAADFILLHNGNIIEGESYSIGSHIVVDRGDGNELKLDLRQVATRATSITELYQFRKSKRQSTSVSSFQDDARWCFRHGLLSEMADAIGMAEELDPTHPETLRLRRQLTAHFKLKLDRNGQESNPMYTVLQDDVPTAEEAQVNRTSSDDFTDLNLPPQLLAHFSNRIQPLLINRCGNNGCHRAPADSGWELSHMGTHIRPSARMTKLNLIATIKMVRGSEGSNDDFLRYASQAHGGKLQSPLKSTDQLSLESLTHWVHEVMTTGSAGSEVELTELLETSGQAIPVADQSRTVDLGPTAFPPVRQVGYVDDATDAAVPRVTNAPNRVSADGLPQTQRDTGRPVRLPAVANPFDPAIFNRHYRSMRPESTGPR